MLFRSEEWLPIVKKEDNSGSTATVADTEKVVKAVPMPDQQDKEVIEIRAHNGEYTFVNDLDDAPETITVSTDLFSSYAIAHVETDETGTDDGAECGLCHTCPTFLGICCFIWLAIIITLVLIIYIIWRKKRQKEEKRKNKTTKETPRQSCFMPVWRNL